MKSSKNQPKHYQSSVPDEKNVPAQKDGFRYDYNDSSDFKNDEKI